MASIQIIGICGKKFNGKDTIADHLVKHYGYTKISLADSLKRAMKEIFGFSDEQLWGDKKEVVDEFWKITPREVLQFVGTDCFRNVFGTNFSHIGNNIWILSLQRNIDIMVQQGIKKIVVPDVRFPNEAQLIQKYNGTVIRVNRLFQHASDNDTHASETSIDLIQPNHIIINDSLLQLYNDIDELVKHLE
jgi:hypothetical protein